MFNITSEALKWLYDNLKPRWLWVTIAVVIGVFSVWSSLPDRARQRLVDFAVPEDTGPPVDVEVAELAVEPKDDPDLVFLRNKIERNLVELLLANGQRTAHRLGLVKPSGGTHPKFEGTVARQGEAAEINVRFLDAGATVVASSSFEAPIEFLRANYKALPETILYGLDIGSRSLKPLGSKARPTASLPAYMLYLKARDSAGAQQLDRALEQLDAALVIDPVFAMAHWAAGQVLRAANRAEDGARRERMAASINLDHPKMPILPGTANPLPDALRALAATPWRSVSKGLDWRQVAVASYKLAIHAWRFDPKAYRIAVAVAPTPAGVEAKALRRKQGAILAVNGGFFDIDGASRLTPLGDLVSGGKRISSYSPKAGSALLFEKDGAPGIAFSKDAGALGALAEAVQAGPMVVDPGGKNGILKNDYNRHNRTAVCLAEGQLVIVVVEGGVSLFELGEILSAPASDGGFACERAMNLDGGPSTQASFRAGGRTAEIEGVWPAQNVVLVMERKS